MVKIRLARFGKRNSPAYRVVVVDSTKKNRGEAIAILGYWHPYDKEIKIDKKAIENWENKGAQVSATVKKLLTK